MRLSLVVFKVRLNFLKETGRVFCYWTRRPVFTAVAHANVIRLSSPQKPSRLIASLPALLYVHIYTYCTVFSPLRYGLHRLKQISLSVSVRMYDDPTQPLMAVHTCPKEIRGSYYVSHNVLLANVL